MASQYAGWQINPEGYFAMGSGPMRAAAGVEELFDVVAGREESAVAVGVIETGKLPNAEVAQWIADKCRVQASELSLLAARTASPAGNLQVVARSVETAMHKLFDLGYPLDTVESGMGSAPLPPVAADDLTGIGRTNDAILYGGQVTLWVRNDDDVLADMVQRIPSCASRDFGQPFQSIFAQYDHDFYKIDPHLFSPAVIRLVNLKTGHSFQAGQIRLDLLRQSFYGSDES
jgi:methenyltetrahydromethanopterin cyclohydrolase